MPSISVKIAFIIIVLLYACQPEKVEKNKNSHNKVFNKDTLKNQFIKANKQIIQKENDEMDYYTKAHQMAFVNTRSGIRYFVYKPSAKGDSVKDGSEITMSYKVSLLNGTECYSSKTDGNKTFKVGQEDIESGIHKAVLYLKHGDKALILIPSYLAHGLLGDLKKIPPQMPIIYDIEIF
jgi:FKBP-type peptidyl-prolyl cis-trans isomerase FkpA